MQVLAGDGGLRLRQTVAGPRAALVPEPTEEHDLVAVADGVFVVRPPGTQNRAAATCHTPPTGERYLHLGVRAIPKES